MVTNSFFILRVLINTTCAYNNIKGFPWGFTVNFNFLKEGKINSKTTSNVDSVMSKEDLCIKKLVVRF